MELQTFTSFQFCILLVWSANGNAPFQGKFQVNLLMMILPMELCDVILRTNRVRCALNLEIFDLLNEESVSGARSSRASLLIRPEVLLSMFENVSRSLKYDSNIFFDHKHIHMDTTVDHFTPLALHVRGNNGIP